MMVALFLIVEITGLFLVSRTLTNQLFQIFLVIFRFRSVAVSAITALLFPGTVIHELSHLFTAEILGVKTGKLTLAPESIRGEQIHMGSVELSHTDPFRRSVIGLAPFFVGLTALFGLSSVLPTLWTDTLIAFQNNTLFSTPHGYLLLLFFYFLFAISNTMFTSSEDMKGVIPLATVLGLLMAAGYIAGLRVGITGVLAEKIMEILTLISKSVAAVLILNLSLFLITFLILKASHHLAKK